jgi:hypothetical protein
MDERFECFGVRPKALVFRFYSDGSYEEFWELASGALRMDRTWRILNPTACPAYSSTSSDCRRGPSRRCQSLGHDVHKGFMQGSGSDDSRSCRAIANSCAFPPRCAASRTCARPSASCMNALPRLKPVMVRCDGSGPLSFRQTSKLAEKRGTAGALSP